ncbi:sugar diacid recognition domain-containing protein [Shewanella sp. Isolate11]|uniref:sugar diacid recognition domain-containing protein n=1 Tax=Shewanella sp. Isolate11 TaxID=2908530 RepID=UPI001EFD81B3|nr:sugar diacid recognition domain-containing protein [Shewanella sp. Isolate11]MCG9696205.1 helix-turn-helix domain-containing protein [Shewanella sp. Isolate11]
MYFLDSQLAQQIVDRTMAIIDHNINVMNNQGVILGSGDPHRIGFVHEGALLAISQNRTVTINSASASSLHGVKPGINLPLHFQGEIIGVIGITGDPQHLNAYGELLKMSAEMIVEQANSLELAQWQNRQQEEFILQFIKGEYSDIAQLEAWANRLNIDLYMPRVAAVIEVQDGGHAIGNSLLKQVLNLLENPSRGNLIAMTSMTELVILKPAFLDGKQWNANLESQRIDQLLKRIPNSMRTHLKIALGHYFPNPTDIHRSYQTAKETLQFGIQMQPDKSKYLFEDFSLLVMLSGLKQDWRGQQLLTPFQKLIAHDNNQQLRKTLTAYLTHFGDQGACAKQLYIHRNTLRYRLDKITQITGIELNKLDGLLQLYLGQILLTKE